MNWIKPKNVMLQNQIISVVYYIQKLKLKNKMMMFESGIYNFRSGRTKHRRMISKSNSMLQRMSKMKIWVFKWYLVKMIKPRWLLQTSLKSIKVIQIRKKEQKERKILKWVIKKRCKDGIILLIASFSELVILFLDTSSINDNQNYHF